MKRFNLVASVFAVAVLALTVASLLWLRWRAAQSLDHDIRNAAAAFDPPPAALGEPSDPGMDFEAAEAKARSARLSPYIRNVAVTKTLRLGDAPAREIPVIPYDLAAAAGEGGWSASLAGYRRIPLAWNGREYGFLYLDVDTGPERAATWTIAAASVALLLATLALIARIYSQQSAIARVGSELDQRKRELIRLERLALAGQLTANLLHDLKKPVLSLRRQLEDLRDEAGQHGSGGPNGGRAPSPAEEQRRVGQIVDEAEEQIRLFFQMLNDTNLEKFVRSGTLAEEYVDLRDSLRMSARLVHYERGAVELSEDFVGELPAALAQPFRLIQVFSNLILNAYQALGGRGRVTLSARAVPGGVIAEVADNGPGVPPEIRESIFDPFFTTKAEQEGSGLGLAICRLIVEEMRGKITLESPEGGGSIFRVRLPIDAE